MQKYIFFWFSNENVRNITLFDQTTLPDFWEGLCSTLFYRSLQRPTGNHFIHVCFESENGASINKGLCEVP